MKAAAEAARMLRDSNPVADDAFAGAARDPLGRATFERIVGLSPGPAQVTGRPPRWRRPFWLATVAAGVAVAAVAAVVVPGVLLRSTQGPGVAAAAVVQRVDSALSTADPGSFAQMTVTTSVAPMHGGKTTTSTAQEWSYGDQWRSVTYSPAGHPVYDEGFTTSSGYTLVSYPARTWARQHGLGLPAGLPGPPGCGRVFAAGPALFQPSLPVTGVLPRSPLTVARMLRAAVSCGTLATAGRQRVNGIEAIELTSRRGPLHETIWVSPGSYLPVRVVVRSTPGRSLILNRETVRQQTANISWLRPTAQNLAKLTVPTPAGFHRVTLGRALQSIVPQLPGGLLLPLDPSGFGGGGPGRPRPLVPAYQKPPKSS